MAIILNKWTTASTTTVIWMAMICIAGQLMVTFNGENFWCEPWIVHEPIGQHEMLGNCILLAVRCFSPTNSLTLCTAISYLSSKWYMMVYIWVSWHIENIEWYRRKVCCGDLPEYGFVCGSSVCVQQSEHFSIRHLQMGRVSGRTPRRT